VEKEPRAKALFYRANSYENTCVDIYALKKKVGLGLNRYSQNFWND